MAKRVRHKVVSGRVTMAVARAARRQANKQAITLARWIGDLIEAAVVRAESEPARVANLAGAAAQRSATAAAAAIGGVR